MGVIFQRTVSDQAIQQAIAASIQPHLERALGQAPPDETDLAARAQSMAEQAATAAAPAAQGGGAVSIQTKPFAISLGLFFLLLAIAVFLDWKNVVDDPKVYSGMVTTVLGAVIGFLGGDAAGTASSP